MPHDGVVVLFVRQDRAPVVDEECVVGEVEASRRSPAGPAPDRSTTVLVRVDDDQPIVAPVGDEQLAGERPLRGLGDNCGRCRSLGDDDDARRHRPGGLPADEIRAVANYRDRRVGHGGRQRARGGEGEVFRVEPQNVRRESVRCAPAGNEERPRDRERGRLRARRRKVADDAGAAGTQVDRLDNRGRRPRRLAPEHVDRRCLRHQRPDSGRRPATASRRGT